MTSATAMGTDRLAGLQLGRAIAAIAVVIGHAIAYPYPETPELTHLLARYGVTIFFVISGYIMVHTTGLGAFDARRFITRRLIRIVPLYYFATFLLLALTLAVPSAFRTTIFEPWSFAASLLFIPEFRPGHEHIIAPFFRLGWTLNYEMFFYVVFAALAVMTAMRRTMLITTVFVALVVIGLITQPTAAIPAFYTEISILGFVAGMWVAMVTMRKPGEGSRPLRWGLHILSVVALAAMIPIYGDIRVHPLTQVWLVTACAVQVWLLATARMRVPRPLIIAGDASYSIYLFHMFAIGFVTAIARFVPPSLTYFMIVIAAVLGVAAGVIAHYLVELPLTRWVRRRFEPRKAGTDDGSASKPAPRPQES